MIPLEVDDQIQLLYADIRVFKDDLLIGLMLPKSKPNDLRNTTK